LLCLQNFGGGEGHYCGFYLLLSALSNKDLFSFGCIFLINTIDDSFVFAPSVFDERLLGFSVRPVSGRLSLKVFSSMTFFRSGEIN